MKFVLLLSLMVMHSAFAAETGQALKSKYESECYKGSRNSALWPDHARDLKQEEEECVDRKMKGGGEAVASNGASELPAFCRSNTKEEKVECANWLKLKASQESAPKSAEEAKKLFTGQCNKTPSKDALYPDQAREVREEEAACVEGKMAEFKKSQMKLAPSAERCEHEEGVAFHCPEGIYKFQGANELSQINSELSRTSKEVKTSRAPAKKSSSSTVKQK